MEGELLGNISNSNSDSGDTKSNEIEAIFYTNSGEQYMSVTGNQFTITPNKVKEYAYDSSGSWISSYTTSSVITINIDGKYIESCGDTVIFKDKRLTFYPVDDLKDLSVKEEDKEMNESANSSIHDYYRLSLWWLNLKERGQNGAKVILVQSQDGNNLGLFVGNDVTWKVSKNLPKSTVITIDGLDVIIHRANFQIIDSALISE